MITDSLHPLYNKQSFDWLKWRRSYEGGECFVDNYLKKFSKRENNEDFRARKEFTPIATFAKGAINEIKNSIFQRTADVTRKGGPQSYQEACEGRLGGVDQTGASMNWFLGHYIIHELLVMKKVGIFIDNGQVGPTLADQNQVHPYIYHYTTENIRNWRYEKGRLVALILRDFTFQLHKDTGLPIGEEERYRHIYLKQGQVVVDLYNIKEEKTQTSVLNIKEIPFVPFEITESLMKDICNHQIALMNAESSDMSFILKANIPFYIEQTKGNTSTKAIKEAQTQYQNVVDPNCPPENEPDKEATVGATEGRTYPIGANAPAFINASSEPLRASMDKQKGLKEDIRLLVHLALSNVQAKMASAESKKFDLGGLESGLSYIGLELEHGERRLGDIWAQYENKNPPTVIYPKRWDLKSEDQQRKEVQDLEDIRDSIGSRTFQLEISKQIAATMVGNRVSTQVLEQIFNEIDNSPVITADATQILDDKREGLVSAATASIARGYKAGEADLAQKEYAARLAQIQASQSAARGNPDLAQNPVLANAEKIGVPGRGTAA